MATKKSTNLLQRLVHPYAAAAVLVGGVALVIFAIFGVSRLSMSPSMQKIDSVPTSSPAPTVTPTPIDTSNWRTYTDWKYGISIKLPPQYFSMIPGRGATGSDPDPESGGEMNFEDSQYTMPNNDYGFTVRIHRGNHLDQNCTTDQECFDLLYKFHYNLPYTNVYLLHTKILSRDIKGVAIRSGVSSTGIDDVYFEFTQNGKPYELNVYDIGSLAQLRIDV